MATSEPLDSVLKSAIQQLGTRPAHCPAHGAFEANGTRLRGREIWSTCQACYRAQLQDAQDAQAQRHAEIVARQREEALGLACIPQRFQGLTFDGYVTETPQQRAVLARVRDFAERFDEHRHRGTGLVLAGKPGTGKTHLAAALCLALLDSGVWVQYVTCMALIRMVRDTWGRDAERTERSVVNLLGQRIDLLVIDEVGVQYGTESEQHILFEVLDKRYAEMRPTLLITNQDRTGFIKVIGERVADRLTQTHDWLVFDWASHRRSMRAAT